MANKTGDIRARKVLEKSAYELFELLNKVVFRLNLMESEFGVSLNGGVLKNNKFVRDNFLNLVKENYKKVNILNNSTNSVLGAIHLAKNNI